MRKILSLFVALVATCALWANDIDYDFKLSQQGWTIDGDDIWTQTSSYGMKASAYIDDENVESESWLISPTLDFAGSTSVTFQFNHARKFGSNNDLGVFISNNNGRTWTEIYVPNWPSGANWNFISSGIIDITSYCSSLVSR